MSTAALLEHQIAVLDEATVVQAGRAVEQLERLLRCRADAALRSVSLTGDGDTALEISERVLRLLVDILTEIADGNAVAVVPVRIELTAGQAADLLDVSRGYLKELLDAGRIPHRLTDDQRRVLLTDLIDYKHRDDAYRLGVADRLTAEAQRLGLDY